MKAFRKIKLAAVGVSLIGLSGAVQAVMPVHGDTVVDATGVLGSPFELDTFKFGINMVDVGTYRVELTSPDATNVAFGVSKLLGSNWNLIQSQSGLGSFDFYADAGKYEAFLFGFGATPEHFHFTISPVPEVQAWAMMAVGAGLIGLRLRNRDKSTFRAT